MSSINETYKCTNAVCHWDDTGHNIDWGYFTNKTGKCGACIDFCDKEKFCQSVECCRDYCSWWKNDKCNTPVIPDKKLQTCTKNSFLDG